MKYVFNRTLDHLLAAAIAMEEGKSPRNHLYRATTSRSFTRDKEALLDLQEAAFQELADSEDDDADKGDEQAGGYKDGMGMRAGVHDMDDDGLDVIDDEMAEDDFDDMDMDDTEDMEMDDDFDDMDTEDMEMDDFDDMEMAGDADQDQGNKKPSGSGRGKAANVLRRIAALR